MVKDESVGKRLTELRENCGYKNRQGFVNFLNKNKLKYKFNKKNLLDWESGGKTPHMAMQVFLELFPDKFIYILTGDVQKSILNQPDTSCQNVTDSAIKTDKIEEKEDEAVKIDENSLKECCLSYKRSTLFLEKRVLELENKLKRQIKISKMLRSRQNAATTTQHLNTGIQEGSVITAQDGSTGDRAVLPGRT